MQRRSLFLRKLMQVLEELKDGWCTKLLGGATRRGRLLLDLRGLELKKYGLLWLRPMLYYLDEWFEKLLLLQDV